MAETRAWFEGELRRMLGFDEVEEIAGFALDNFPVSKPAELRQYLEQFLGQSREVEKLCDQLSARRKGRVAPTTGATAATNDKLSASDDFWGGGGGRGSSTKSNSSVSASATASSRRGQQMGKNTPVGGEKNVNAKGKPMGKVYQKAAVEEDFWGGGRSSARSKTTLSSSTSSSTPSPAPPSSSSSSSAQFSKVGARKGGGTGVGGSRSATPSTTVKKKPSAKQPSAPQVVGVSKNKAGGGAGGSAGKIPAVAAVPSSLPSAPSTRGAKKSAIASVGGTAKATALPPAPPEKKWSGVTCLCMGKIHDLITNCTSCGKIACVKEGGFYCSFCGSALPTTGREPNGGGGGGGGGDAGTEPHSAALKEALERKDRLLLFDRTSAQRTTVLDDQGDYFTSHNWLSKGEREKGEAEEKARRDDAASLRGARRPVKMSIDIMGRRVIETQQGTSAEEGAGKGGAPGGETNGRTSTAGGLSLDLSSSTNPGGNADGGDGSRHTGSGAASAAAYARDGYARDKGESRRDGAAEEQSFQRPSLENTGLRGRAKEVYDVMRANLDKKRHRQRSGGTGSRPFVAAEKSRISLWRVQPGVEKDDDFWQQDQPDGLGLLGAGFEKFEPTDALNCAR